MSTSTFDRGIRNYKGTNDFFGDYMRWRQQTIAIIRNVFESFGFEPLETPVLETTETLTGKYGDEGEANWFRLAARRPDDGGLRYDHTVPLSRFMAMNWNEVIKPYKRYAIGPVFRLEKTQAGRYRQFTQCDFDTVGSSSPVVDAEVISVNSTVLSNLGFPDIFTIRINDRRFLNAVVQELGFTNEKQVNTALRGWDKQERITKDQIREELLSSGVSKKLLLKYEKVTNSFLDVSGEAADVVLSAISKMFPNSEPISNALRRLDTIANYVSAMGVSESKYRLWPTLARGLAYYTGPIFETVVEKKGIGSISGGGRFDNLIEALGGPDLPASGSSFGLERVMEVMEDLALRPESSQTTDVFVTLFDLDNEELCQASFQIARKLRLTGYGVEVYTGEASKLGKQLDIANRKEIPLATIIGPEELDQNTVAVKDLRVERGKKSQFIVNKDEFLSKVKSMI